jgi:hypothetical protein
MRYYKVLHDFHAADSVELSVKKGDLVAAPEHVEQDGWLKVELASDSRRRGFVPATYVRECGAPPSTPTQLGALPFVALRNRPLLVQQWLTASRCAPVRSEEEWRQAVARC